MEDYCVVNTSLVVKGEKENGRMCLVFIPNPKNLKSDSNSHQKSKFSNSFNRQIAKATREVSQGETIKK